MYNGNDSRKGELARMEEKWLRCIRLSLKISKRSYMIISNRSKLLNDGVKIRNSSLSFTTIF